MWRKRLLHAIFNVGYWHSLGLGLAPAPLNWRTQQFEPSRRYLAYSALMHGVCLLLVPLSLLSLDARNFMPDEPVLKWTYKMTNAAKSSAVLLLIVELWWRRDRWLTTLSDYRAIVARHNELLQSATCGDECGVERQRIERYVARHLISKFGSGLATIWLFFISFWQTHPGGDWSYTALLAINFVLSALLLTAMGQVFYALCQLYAQFALVNMSLRAAIHEMHALRGVEGDASVELLQRLARRVHDLAALRFACYRLTRQVFRICQTATAAILLRIFLTNVRIVHHFLLRFINASWSEDGWTTACIVALMLFFYWDAILFMIVIDDVLAACNGTGRLLRDCTELVVDASAAQLLTRALEQFALQVQCHRLCYRVCGLFEVNKETSLVCFLTVFVQVSVLVQFDLKYAHK